MSLPTKETIQIDTFSQLKTDLVCKATVGTEELIKSMKEVEIIQ